MHITIDGKDHDAAPAVVHVVHALTARVRELEEQAEGLEGHRRGLYRVFQALAEMDRVRLATVDEHIQADVDTVVAREAHLQAKVHELESDVETARAIIARDRAANKARESNGERCMECGAELTACGEMSVDGPRMDCPLCQSRDQVYELEKLLLDLAAAVTGFLKAKAAPPFSDEAIDDQMAARGRLDTVLAAVQEAV